MFVFDAQKVGSWVTEKAGGTVTKLCKAIGYEHNGQLIGAVMYDGFTGDDDGGGTIFIHSRIDLPNKLPREFYWMVFDYPFNQLKVQYVRGIVNANNLQAQKFNEHVGFKREALLRDYFLNGDAIIYGITRDDCRFLGDKYVRFSQTA